MANSCIEKKEIIIESESDTDELSSNYSFENISLPKIRVYVHDVNFSTEEQVEEFWEDKLQLAVEVLF